MVISIAESASKAINLEIPSPQPSPKRERGQETPLDVFLLLRFCFVLLPPFSRLGRRGWGMRVFNELLKLSNPN
jgi:hypothetical protein